MKSRKLVAALMVLSTFGCTLNAPKDPEHVALKVGESHAFSEFLLTFVGVESDSRCPAQAMCVWAGNAVVAVTAATAFPTVKGAALAKRFLNTNSDPRSLKVAGATLALDSLSPKPITTDSIPQANYTAYFTVTRP